MVKEKIVDSEGNRCFLSNRIWVNELRNYFVLAIILCLFFTYYAFALTFDRTKTKLLTLIALATFVYLFVLITKIVGRCLPTCVSDSVKKKLLLVKLIRIPVWRHHLRSNLIHLALFFCYGNYILMTAAVSFKKLLSLVGVLSFIVLSIVTSQFPKEIDWKTVNISLALQTLITSAVLRTKFGYEISEFIYKEAAKLICLYPASGAAFVYGDPAFLFHPNAMYVTSVATSVVCFLTILVTSAIKVRSFKNVFLKIFFNISVHTFIWAACQLYVIIAAYSLAFSLIFGVQIKYIVNGVAMYIPGSTVIYFISFPKNNKTKKQIGDILKTLRRPTTNYFLGNFALWAYKGFIFAWTVIALFLAWAAIYRFFDSILLWFGSKIGIDLTITTVFGVLLLPMITVIGIEWNDAILCGKIISEKIFGVSQFAVRQVAHSTVSGYMQNTSIASLTYSCLGFCSIGWYCVIFSLSLVLNAHNIRRQYFPVIRFLFVVHLSGLYISALGATLSPENMASNVDHNNFSSF